MPETALVVEVPEAEPLVSEWRAKHDWSAQRGVPAHITILYPFAPTERVDKELLDGLRQLFARRPAFSFRLPRVARFPAVAWLAPEPAEPFKALIELVAAEYPDYPPYEGIHDEVIPHLTVAEGTVDFKTRSRPPSRRTCRSRPAPIRCHCSPRIRTSAGTGPSAFRSRARPRPWRACAPVSSAAPRAGTVRSPNSSTSATCSGVPVAITSPPASPPSGPRSMIQSACLITSRLCSITSTVLPESTSR